nr:hypothetical protein [Tanacetum cinerariifolium]
MVVLDLDETLACAYEISGMPDSARKQATDAGLTWFELECVSSYSVRTISFIKRMVIVDNNPFSLNLSKQSKISSSLEEVPQIGLEGYARSLVDKIDAETGLAVD